MKQELTQRMLSNEEEHVHEKINNECSCLASGSWWPVKPSWQAEPRRRPSSSTEVHERKKSLRGGKVKKERTQRVTHCWQCLQLLKKVVVFESLQALSDARGGN